MALHSKTLQTATSAGDAIPNTVQWVSEDASTGVVLAHGAGGDKDSGNLPAFSEAFAKAGLPCIRFTCKPPNLPHRVKVCKAVLDGASTQSPFTHVKSWILAGHSMGARVASSVADVEQDKVAGCVFLSYPLHPPGKQDQLRDTPLTQLNVPLLFVRGTKDNMCEQAKFDSIRSRLQAAEVQVHEIEGGDHGLKVKGAGGAQASRAALEEAVQKVIAFAVHVSEQHSAESAAEPSKPPHAGKGRGKSKEQAAQQGSDTTAGESRKRTGRSALTDKSGKKPTAKAAGKRAGVQKAGPAKRSKA